MRQPAKTSKSLAADGNNAPLNARVMMERFMRGFGKDAADLDTPEERAQELVYQAWEESTARQAVKLMIDALELDSFNVDARLFMLDVAAESGAERIESLQEIVAGAAKKLGPEAFKEMTPHFWGFTETRPYMRARQQLAEELRAAGRLEGAVTEYEGMLGLNPNDNQGLRYSLLPCYLALDRRAEARKLMKQYPDDVKFSPVFAWGLVLLRYRTPRKTGLETALAAARKQNPHMEAYLKGHRHVPKNLPRSYSMGSREEAVCFAEILKMAWFQHREALGWLVAQKPGKANL